MMSWKCFANLQIKKSISQQVPEPFQFGNVKIKQSDIDYNNIGKKTYIFVP